VSCPRRGLAHQRALGRTQRRGGGREGWGRLQAPSGTQDPLRNPGRSALHLPAVQYCALYVLLTCQLYRYCAPHLPAVQYCAPHLPAVQCPPGAALAPGPGTWPRSPGGRETWNLWGYGVAPLLFRASICFRRLLKYCCAGQEGEKRKRTTHLREQPRILPLHSSLNSTMYIVCSPLYCTQCCTVTRSYTLKVFLWFLFQWFHLPWGRGPPRPRPLPWPSPWEGQPPQPSQPEVPTDTQQKEKHSIFCAFWNPP